MWALNAQHTTQGPGCTETKMANTIKVNDLPISKVVFPPLSFVINLMDTFIEIVDFLLVIENSTH